MHTYLIFCRNLQLIIRWRLRVTLRPWESSTLGLQISIGFWKRSASVAYESNNPWVLSISYVFSRGDAPLSAISALIEMPSFTADLTWRPAPPPPPWSRHDILVLLSRHHLGTIENVREGSAHLTGSSFTYIGGNDEDITSC